MPNRSLTIAAVGDVMLLHPVSACMTDPACAAVLASLREADVAFGNCEVSGFDPALPGAVPQNESGGFWLNAGPEGLADLRALGFTMMSRANNHTLDFGVGGMDETNRLLAQHGIVHAGTGATLAAARAPAYLTTRAGRVALVSATDTAARFAMAGDARPDMGGRPGVNRIRSERQRIVDRRTFGALLEAIEIAREQDYQLGDVSDDGRALRGLGLTIRAGQHPHDEFVLNKGDVAGNLDQVRAARQRADYVLFTLHTHMPKKGPEVPQAIREFARSVIDAGADAVIAHGPHRLRGIEIHRERPIFYSLGNFMCHLPKVGAQPADFYDKFAPEGQHSAVADMLVTGDWRAHVSDDAEAWEGVLVVIREESRRIIELHPLDLSRHASGARLGTPAAADEATGKRIIEQLAELSRPFGTDIAYVGGLGLGRIDIALSEPSLAVNTP